jgi:hypothetical protein
MTIYSEEAFVEIVNHVKNTTWQPIELAPRDGTHVLLYAPEWAVPNTGWTYGNDRWQDCPFNGTPTHWMPLPEPPEAA